MKTYVCLNCGEENIWKRSTKNKFCDNKCFQEFSEKEKFSLIEQGLINSFNKLRTYLLKTVGKCYECGVGQYYNGKPLTLHCDHIDGNSDNNTLDNLRLLCPNCHSQTETYCGRNKKNSKRNNYLRKYKAK